MIGHVDDVFADGEGWDVRCFEFEPRNWLQDKKVYVAPVWIDHISGRDQWVVMTLSQETSQSAPAYNPFNLITQEYIVDLLKHCVNTRPYGRPRTVRRGQDLCTSLLDRKRA
jgi:hypothetical protein